MRRVDQLWVGDRVFTPAGRWETVTNIDGKPGAYLARLYTDATGPTYAWVLPGSRELPSMDRVNTADIPTVRIYDDRTRVMAYLDTCEFPWGTAADLMTLVDAIALGRGQGWEVCDRPNGGPVVTTVVASKSAAMSAVRRAARAHAKALRVRLHRPEPRKENRQ